MENKGWISRTRSEEDERKVIVALTKEGLEMREKAKDIPSKAGACLPLSMEEAKELYNLLYKVLEA